MKIHIGKKTIKLAAITALGAGILLSGGMAHAAGRYYTKINAHTYYIYTTSANCYSENNQCHKSSFCGTTLYARTSTMNLIADKLRHNFEVRISRTSNSQLACTLKP